MADRLAPAPAALQWQEDGELAAQDLFALVCRLKDVEPADHSNELWRLGQKLPGRSCRTLPASSSEN
jgi:hypothetical protein